MISILTPAFNEAANLPRLYDRVVETMRRVGGDWAVRTYDRILANEGSQVELGILERVADGLQNGRCLCGLGDSAGWVIDSTFRHFREEYEDHALRHTCKVGSHA